MSYEDRMADYVDVAERIRIFRERYPEGSLQPLDPTNPFRIVEIAGDTFVAYTAVAYRHPDDRLPGIAVSWEPYPGTTPYTRLSELQNAETAAWGRAIVAALAADTKKIASLDEVRARRGSEPSQTRQEPRRTPQAPAGDRGATDGQKRLLEQMAGERGYVLPDVENLTFQDASDLITKLKTIPKLKNHGSEEEAF